MCPKFKVTAALLALITFAPPGFAQQQGQTRGPSKYRNQQKSPQVLRQASANATYGRMNAAPDLPNFPAFTSGKFMYARQGDVGRSQQKAVHIEYAINDPPGSVIGWYENALRQYNWKISGRTEYSLYASRPKDGNSVNVFVDNNHQVGYRYRLNIAYKFFKPVDDGTENPSRNINSNVNQRPPQGNSSTPPR